MSAERIAAYRDASERVALRQAMYFNGELLTLAEVPEFQRKYHAPVCFVCCGRPCRNPEACIEATVEWFGLWPSCCTSPATCSHESYRIAGAR